MQRWYAPLFFLLFPINVYCQTDWSLKVNRDGIKVYTRYTDGSQYKAIRTTCVFDASLSKLAAVLLDAGSSTEWVYATKSSTVLKQISTSELIYHSEVDVPWPFSNRDFIVQLTVSQDPKTKQVTVAAENKPAYIAENKNVVRVQYSHSQWKLDPMPNGKVKAEFTLQTDPGGNIPAWLINMFATKGPFESFKNLRGHIKKPAYSQVRLSFIKD
jgi:hypothetical protein